MYFSPFWEVCKSGVLTHYVGHAKIGVNSFVFILPEARPGLAMHLFQLIK